MTKQPSTPKPSTTKKPTTVIIKPLPGYPYRDYGIKGPPAPYNKPK